MQRRSFLVLAGLLPGATAWAQASLRPDPTPRLPPQPGQGLPLEDRRFLRDALALSRAEAEAAGRAEGQGGEEVRRFAAAVAGRHRRLAQQIEALARERNAGVAEGEAAPGVARALRLLAAPGQAAGDAERGFLAAQLEIHPTLAALYQAQASQTTDRDLARLAITALAGIQEDFAAATRLGAPLGLAPPERTIANPPQYGTAPSGR